ncbi:MAG: 4-hydroxy-2-oxoheptanedioate aldolase [Granulosicoccus sp.]|jgi:4-hydroxy-2-oxoheptanedioate aldolase
MSRKRKTNSEKSPLVMHQLSANKVSLASGCWINIFDPTIGELVGSCGYDYAMIDMEHSPVSLDSTLNMIRAVQSGGAKAMVRVPDKQPVWIGRLMDMGADAVMVPMVNSVEEAQILAKSAVYAPVGTRGMAAGIVRATGYGVDTDAYLSHYRENFMLLIQIESREAVEAAAELASVDGIDGIFIGPYDLAGSLGNLGQPEHKETRAAIRKVLKAVKSTGKPVSTLTNPARNARRLFAEGYQLVFSGSDLGMIRGAFQTDVANHKKLSG